MVKNVALPLVNSDVATMIPFFRFTLLSYLLMITSVLSAEVVHDPEENLLLLKNDRIEVGLLPQAGGRIVLLRRPGQRTGGNILLSDPAKWTPADTTPQPSPTAYFVDYNGHEIWVGPQQDWWTQQNVNPDRAKSKAVWPPDPWLNVGRYEVVEHKANSIVLRGPPSPVSGVQLTKEVRIQDDGTVVLKTTAVNVRNEAVSWDLWSLTRLPGRAAAYAPLATGQNCRIELATGDLAHTEIAPHLARDGVFAFDSHAALPDGMNDLAGKAFLNPENTWIAAFNAGACLLKTMVAAPVAKIHPAQAAIEIFVDIRAPQKGTNAPADAAGLLELEFHSEYRKLQSGESLTMEESWKIIPYDGPDTADGHIAFLKGQGILKTVDRK